MSGPAGAEVVRRASNDLVEFPDDGGVEVVVALGQFAHLVSKFLLGFGSNALGAGRDHKPQEGVTLAVGG